MAKPSSKQALRQRDDGHGPAALGELRIGAPADKSAKATPRYHPPIRAAAQATAARAAISRARVRVRARVRFRLRVRVRARIREPRATALLTRRRVAGGGPEGRSPGTEGRDWLRDREPAVPKRA